MRVARPVAATGFALLSGAAGWASHAPVGASVLAYLAVPLLLVAIRAGDDDRLHGRPALRAAVIGFVAGLATFLPLFPWLVPPAGYLAWLLLAVLQAGWYAAFAAAVRPALRSGWVLLVAPLLWTGMEVWRGTVPLGGFPWGELGYAHVNSPWLLPIARVVGVHGLTFLTVAVGVALYRAVDHARAPGRLHPATAPAAALVVFAALPPLAAPAAPPTTGQDLDVLAVQGNDLESFTGTASEEDHAIAERMVALTAESVARHGPPDVTIWPESSIDRDPFSASGDALLPYIEAGANLTGGGLLFGVNLDGPRPEETFLNSALLVDADATVVDRYVKRHYVPFGEYVPWRAVLGRFPPLRQVPRDGVSGGPAHAIVAQRVRAAVVICYETLFPEVVRTNLRAGDAGLLVAMTNDASFGRSWQNEQHIAQSRMRAVETGRWTVHAALSGESALIDPDGQVVQKTAAFERATIRSDVPVVAADTPYVLIGGFVHHGARWLAAGLAAILAAIAWRRRHSRAGPDTGNA